jgi:hypothetical protein
MPGFGLLLLAVVFMAIAGCSGDDSNTPAGVNLTEGSLTDPQFLLVQGQIDSYLDSTQNVFSVGLENINQLPTDTEEVHNIHGPMGPNDTAQYTYANGWHVTYIAKYAINFNVHFRDSVQFRKNSVTIESPDSLDYLHYIRDWSLTSNLTSQTHTNLSRNINIIYSNLDSDTATINGTNNSDIEWNFISNDSTVSAVFDMNVTISNVKVVRSNLYGWVSGCACDGSLSMDINETYAATIGQDETNINRNWTVTIDIDSGVATITIVSENETWGYTHTICTLPS